MLELFIPVYSFACCLGYAVWTRLIRMGLEHEDNIQLQKNQTNLERKLFSSRESEIREVKSWGETKDCEKNMIIRGRQPGVILALLNLEEA